MSNLSTFATECLGFTTEEQINAFTSFIETWVNLSGIKGSQEDPFTEIPGEDFQAFAKRLNDFGQKYLFQTYRGKGERANMKIIDLPESARQTLTDSFKKMGQFEGGLPSQAQISFNDTIGVFGAAQERLAGRMKTAYELANMRSKKERTWTDWMTDLKTYKIYRRWGEWINTLMGGVSIRPIVVLAGERPVWYFTKNANGEITTPEPLIFDIIAQKKNTQTGETISPLEVKNKALEIYQSLPDEKTKNNTLAADAINQDPYFKDCIVTETDLAIELAKKYISSHPYDRLLVVNTKSTYDEKGNIKRPTTATTIQTAIDQFPELFLTGRGYMVSDAEFVFPQGLELAHKTGNENFETVAQEEELPTCLDSARAINKSVILAGIIRQVVSDKQQPPRITGQEALAKTAFGQAQK